MLYHVVNTISLVCIFFCINIIIDYQCDDRIKNRLKYCSKECGTVKKIYEIIYIIINQNVYAIINHRSIYFITYFIVGDRKSVV